MHCPDCHSMHVVKNGFNSTKKQMYRCSNCGRQFVLDPIKSKLSDEQKQWIDKLLLERLSLAAIARVIGISQPTVQKYVNQKYENISQEAKVKKKEPGKMVIECDEMWSFVGKKSNKQWIWLAIDRSTREIIGCHIGDRGNASANALWKSLPAIYRQCAVCYTDYWEAYHSCFPKKRHRPVGKESGQTSHIERLNNTFRQRIGRLVRKTVSFSKKQANHVGAIWNFIHHYNSSLNLFSAHSY